MQVPFLLLLNLPQHLSSSSKHHHDFSPSSQSSQCCLQAQHQQFGPARCRPLTNTHPCRCQSQHRFSTSSIHFTSSTHNSSAQLFHPSPPSHFTIARFHHQLSESSHHPPLSASDRHSSTRIRQLTGQHHVPQRLGAEIPPFAEYSRYRDKPVFWKRHGIIIIAKD
ncbi:hypothetical protein BJ508DRAFT_180033 [Ascobolus immersus RN42]|uniref:Uncharacterized protein n=1 Tax=Ascobolus immersus RN42 TaxID=1160509 RepID=A0A3N4HY84_ASCIM|nr:hypothetical protein BJ508DRAFT_180033 [Ascobolus immersus RN42]